MLLYRTNITKPSPKNIPEKKAKIIFGKQDARHCTVKNMNRWTERPKKCNIIDQSKEDFELASNIHDSVCLENQAHLFRVIMKHCSFQTFLISKAKHYVKSALIRSCSSPYSARMRENTRITPNEDNFHTVIWKDRL